jgi:hypothetical protein
MAEWRPVTESIDQCPTPAIYLSNCLRVRGRSARLLAALSIELVELVELMQQLPNFDLVSSAVGMVAQIHPRHLMGPMDLTSTGRVLRSGPVYVLRHNNCLARITQIVP